MQKDSDLRSLHEDERWPSFVEKTQEWQEDYQASLNQPYKERLEKLRVEDQTICFLLPVAEKQFGRDSEAYQWFRGELMVKNDERVLEELLEILETEGWMGISEVGELANQTIWLIIQHAPLSVQEKYLPLLEASVEEGESKAEYLAFLTDRIHMRKGEDQVYGTQAIWDHELERNVIYPVADKETVNERRVRVGLNTIEEYAANNNYLYE